MSVVLVDSSSNSSNTLVLTLDLTVLSATPLPDGGDALPRVHWLNSRLGADDDSVPRPYTTLVVNSSSLPASFSMHGKTVVIGVNGLPATVTTFGPSASPSVDRLESTAVLAPGGAFATVAVNDTALLFPVWTTTTFRGNSSTCEWYAESTDSTGAVTLGVSGNVDATGYLAFDFSVQPSSGTPASSTLAFEFTVPTASSNLLYVPAVQRVVFDSRPCTILLATDTAWVSASTAATFRKCFPRPLLPRSVGDGTALMVTSACHPRGGRLRAQSVMLLSDPFASGVWLGSTTGGIMYKLKGDDPLWQASVPYDDKSSPPPPASWYNTGKGGILLNRSGIITGYSNKYACGPNATTFRASLLVTPVHNLNLSHHFSLRYAQLDAPANYSGCLSFVASVPGGTPIHRQAQHSWQAMARLSLTCTRAML